MKVGTMRFARSGLCAYHGSVVERLWVWLPPVLVPQQEVRLHGPSQIVSSWRDELQGARCGWTDSCLQSRRFGSSCVMDEFEKKTKRSQNNSVGPTKEGVEWPRTWLQQRALVSEIFSVGNLLTERKPHVEKLVPCPCNYRWLHLWALISQMTMTPVDEQLCSSFHLTWSQRFDWRLHLWADGTKAFHREWNRRSFSHFLLVRVLKWEENQYKITDTQGFQGPVLFVILTFVLKTDLTAYILQNKSHFKCTRIETPVWRCIWCAG